MDSILTSIKKMLGIAEDYEHFDTDIIIHINTVLFTLTQLGVGPTEGFTIDDNTATWSDFIGDDCKNFEAVKSYIHMRVRLLFDPPTSSSAMEALNRMISEFEFRLMVATETTQSE